MHGTAAPLIQRRVVPERVAVSRCRRVGGELRPLAEEDMAEVGRRGQEFGYSLCAFGPGDTRRRDIDQLVRITPVIAKEEIFAGGFPRDQRRTTQDAVDGDGTAPHGQDGLGEITRIRLNGATLRRQKTMTGPLARGARGQIDSNV